MRLGVEKTVFGLAQLLGLRRGGVRQPLAAAGHLGDAAGQVAAESRRALRGRGQGRELAPDALQALAGLREVSAEGIALALLLSGGAAALVEHRATVLHRLLRCCQIGSQRFASSLRLGEALLRARQLLLRVLRLHVAGERVRGAGLGHPELDHAVRERHGAAEGHERATDGAGRGDRLERIDDEDVGQQILRGGAEALRADDGVEQAREREIDRCSRRVGGEEARALAPREARDDGRSIVVRAHGDGVHPRAQHGFERGAVGLGRGKPVREGAEHGAFGEAEGVGRIENERVAARLAAGVRRRFEHLDAGVLDGDARLLGGLVLLRLAESRAQGVEPPLARGDGVAVGIDEGVERLGLALDLVEARGEVGDGLAEALLVRGESLVAQNALAGAALGGGKAVLELDVEAFGLRRLGAELLEGLPDGGVRLARGVEAGAGEGESLVGFHEIPFEVGELESAGLDGPLLVGADGLRLADFALVAGDPLAVFGDALLVDAHGVRGLVAATLRLHGELQGGADAAFGLHQLGAGVGDALFAGLDLIAQLGGGGGGGRGLGLEGFDAIVDLADAADGGEAVELAQFGLELLVAAGLAGLALEGADLAVELADDVAQAQEVGVRLLELAHGLLAVGPEAGDAAGLLEDGAAVLGAGGEDRVDLPLGHDGVRGGADARAHEEALYVAQAAGGLVEIVVRVAVAEDAAGDGDLVVLGAEVLLAVGEGDGDLGHAQRLVGVGAVEDHVRHRGAAQRRGALLAEDPADGVGDVALAAAVGADNGGDARLEDEAGFRCEAFEADDFECLEVHGAPILRFPGEGKNEGQPYHIGPERRKW